MKLDEIAFFSFGIIALITLWIIPDGMSNTEVWFGVIAGSMIFGYIIDKKSPYSLSFGAFLLFFVECICFVGEIVFIPQYNLTIHAIRNSAYRLLFYFGFMVIIHIVEVVIENKRQNKQ